MSDWMADSLYILIAMGLVLLNGFFVAAEFALVKIRPGQVDTLVRQGRPFAATAHWLFDRLEASLGACQLGITMASLGLGWIGEPAFSRLLAPLLSAVGISSPGVIHVVGFLVAFGIITSLHLVVGEQAPKILAIRKPEILLLWCALPLRGFYILLYPFLVGLNAATEVLLRRFGVKGMEGHEAPVTHGELQVLLSRAHALGELSRSEHRLIHAAFSFDDLITRRIMVPRSEVGFFDIQQPLAACIARARETRHTRYPVCDGSLDNVEGIAHIKDLVGLDPDEPFDLRSILRKPRQVPETMPVTKLLRHFQSTHELMALVVDEYGTLVGVVTLENVLEEIVGSVEDEFDSEQPPIVEEAPGAWIVLGGTPLIQVNRRLGLDLQADDVDTASGLLVSRLGRFPEVGDSIGLEGARAEVLEVDESRAVRIRINIIEKAPDEE